MKSRSHLAGLAAIVLASSLAALVGRTPAPAAPVAQDAQATDGLITLFAKDALASSVNLRTGAHGGRIVDGEVALDRAQLVYDVFTPGKLSFGFASDEVVNVIDLGPARVVPQTLASDVSLKFPIGLFHTLGVRSKRLVFTEPGGSSASLNAGQKIFGVMPSGLRSLDPQVGHCLVVRFQSTRGDRAEHLAKVEIVDHRPGESITLRWASLGTL